MRVAALQMVSGTEVAANLERAAQLIAEAARAGAQLVALPENFAIMPRGDADRTAATETPGRGPVQSFLAAQANQHGLWLVGGTVPLWNADGTKARSACLLFDPAGALAARYDKMHLFDVKLPGGEAYEESRNFEAGTDVVVADTSLGPIGLAICYDLRFPELFRRMSERGARLFIVPSAFTAQTGRAHWEILVRARAVENTAFVIAPDQGGQHDNGRATHGDTMVVDSWGEVQARRAQGAGVVLADFDAAHLDNVRAALPSLTHRKLSA
ncbi:MAG: carbon-nitrogen hydrolase family protein [Pseudomonadota bacterium]|nr:MAG: carbon-nitrogen hydrolase family protein [Pseudomonadota bacterium]